MAQNVFDSQYSNPCSDLVIELNECFEAYGLWRGKKICKDLQKDLRECNTMGLREKAALEIARVRATKLIKGEINPKDAYLDPAPGNSFVYFPTHK